LTLPAPTNPLERGPTTLIASIGGLGFGHTTSVGLSTDPQGEAWKSGVKSGAMPGIHS
jgi:hypothetical protein